MCQTTVNCSISGMDEITSSTSHKKTGKLIEPRKIRKPLMEKKRRARINQSLDELKRIVVDAEKLAGQDITSRVNKLEKADILEMTVRYLKRNVVPQPERSESYLAGYRQCVEQVQDILTEQWTDEWRQLSGRRMIEHLEARAQRLNASRRHPMPDSSITSSLSSSSEDDDEEFITIDVTNNTTNNSTNSNNTTNTNTTRPSHDRSTQLGEIPPKSMWRPW